MPIKQIAPWMFLITPGRRRKRGKPSTPLALKQAKAALATAKASGDRVAIVRHQSNVDLIKKMIAMKAEVEAMKIGGAQQ